MNKAEVIIPDTSAPERSGLPAVVHSATDGESLMLHPYNAMSIAPFDVDAQKIMGRKVSKTKVQIRPDGLIYLPGVHFRGILNEAFGRGAWAIMPRKIYINENEKKVFFHGALFVLSQFVAESIGEQEYFPQNPIMSYATATEAAKTDCITRCCKDLGIASELWDPDFVAAWKKKYAVQVWCTCVKKGKDYNARKLLWRKANADHFTYPWKEDGASSPEGHNKNKPTTQKSGIKNDPKKLKQISTLYQGRKEFLSDENAQKLDAILKNKVQATATQLDKWIAFLTPKEPEQNAEERQLDEYRKRLMSAKKWFNKATKGDTVFYEIIQGAGFTKESEIDLASFDDVIDRLNREKQRLSKGK